MDLDIPDAEEAIPKPSSRKAKQALSSQEKKKLRKKNQALKKKKALKPKVAAKAPPAEKKTRDFSSDLEAYLQDWNLSQQDADHHWKFNKILQEWGITHCVDKEFVSATCFKLLVPYLVTVQGAARQRMEERLRTVLQEANSSTNVDLDDNALKEQARRGERARKVLIAIGAPVDF